MDLSEPHTAYAALTGRTCGAPPHPGDVELGYIAARFLGALRGTFDAGDSGEVRYVLMPPDQPLPGVEIELVERWFEAGARCD